MADATCICGAVLEPSRTRPRKYCSNRCQRVAYYQRPPASEADTCVVDGCLRRRHVKDWCFPHHSTVFRKEQAANGVPRIRTTTYKTISCERCGKEHSVPASKSTRFCSITCAKNQGKSTALVVYTGHRDPKVNKNPIPKRRGILKSGQCKVCQSWFVTVNMDVTCSPKCQRRWQKHSPGAIDSRRMQRSRRRARMKNAFVENVSPKRLFKRDGYVCQLKLAGCKGIDRTKVFPHPQSPTVDHIIPLSVGVAAGGTHELANCHTACFHCNWTKSDGGGGEQLLLIG